ncbi:unnamed protein product [Paramecium octaurelia]|uniref:Uncharacterized protein n=1 Tax=Paramecium octaurelia TaxID=43137 RepID=A0A8S1V8W1_PAROT|nr:unnamed protein product [Paramecium octaurelia]
MARISFIKVLFTYPIIFYQNCVEPYGQDCKTHLWNLQNRVVPCEGQWFMGQFGGSSDKLILQLHYPQEKKMRFNFTMGKFNSWDYEPFIVQIDDLTVDSFTYGPFIGTITSNLGYIILDPKSYKFIQDASRSSTKISLYSNLDQGLNDESWGFRDVRIEILDPCVDFFSECDFQGEKFSVCAGNQTLFSKNVPFVIKSISFQPGIILKLKDSKYFGGDTQTYSSNQNCIPDYIFPKYKKPEK